MSESTDLAEIVKVRSDAVCLADTAALDHACDQMARKISEKLSRTNPVLLCVLNGGMVPTAMLLQRLEFPLQVDYTHVTRYGLRTSGGELRWVRRPPASLRDRTVLVVDDLLDHGITLQAVVEACEEIGAAQVLTAVLATKDVAERAGLQSTDFSAIKLPDRYIFGYGMDYKSYLRNAPGIFAVDPDP